MNDADVQQRFVCLRAEGRSFARIAEELQVSKPTLIKWSRKFRFEIQNQRAIFFERLQEQWLDTREARLKTLGEQLRQIEGELGKRDLAALTTPQLFSLAHRLRHQIERETGPMQFTSPTTEIPQEEFTSEVQDWKP